MRLADDSGAAIGDDLEGAACVGGRHHRLLGQECLVRDHPEVLVHRGVVDSEAACVQTRELFLVDATGKACTTVEGVPLGNLLEPGPVRSVADDDTPERGIRGKRVEEQLVPLRTVEAADGQHEVVVALGPVRQLLRRMGHHLRRDPGRALESLGDVP